MSKVTIYHNPRCSKSRQTLSLIEDAGVEPTIIKYLEETPTKEALQGIIKKLGISVRDLLRSGEDYYKENNLADMSLTDDQLLNAMLACPKLIERPIVVKGNKAILGRPPEKVLELLV